MVVTKNKSEDRINRRAQERYRKNLKLKKKCFL